MKLYVFTLSLLHIIAFISTQITDSPLNPGDAIDSLRDNNAVVGILYFIVLVQAAVIIKLWMKINQISNERIADLKERLKSEEGLRMERLKSEEDLRREIQGLYSKLS